MTNEIPDATDHAMDATEGHPDEELSGFVSEDDRPEHNIADEQQDAAPGRETENNPGGLGATPTAPVSPDEDPETVDDPEDRLDGTLRNIDGLAPGAGVPPEDVSEYSDSNENEAS